ncbi:MAG: YlbF family regulator [Clostridia bacterium]|nr:YlbF family regulator [Clostridia bacterium]
MTETDDKIIQAAMLLGEAIEGDERRERYVSALQKYEGDENLCRMISEYNRMRSVLNGLYSDGSAESETLEAAEANLNTLYVEITENETYREFSDAKDALDAVISRINAIVRKAATGEDGSCSSCGGNCSSCGGCR